MVILCFIVNQMMPNKPMEPWMIVVSALGMDKGYMDDKI